MKISYCISTYNNLPYLKEVIKSIHQNSFYPIDEIVVYAENCTDGTNEWLAENAAGLKLSVFCEKNEGDKIQGIGGGMNLCSEKAKNELIYFLHSDMYVGPNHDQTLVEIASEKERMVASAYRVEPNIWNQPSRPGCLMVPKEVFGLYPEDFKAEAFNQWAREFVNLNNACIRNAGGAGGFIIRKKDWAYIGGNDPLFKPACYEDIDLFLRMQAEGYDFKMTTKSLIFHYAARGSIFGEDGNVEKIKRSTRQNKAEHEGRIKWVNKWGELFKYDDSHFVVLTETMRKRYELMRNSLRSGI